IVRKDSFVPVEHGTASDEQAHRTIPSVPCTAWFRPHDNGHAPYVLTGIDPMASRYVERRRCVRPRNTGTTRSLCSQSRHVFGVPRFDGGDVLRAESPYPDAEEDAWDTGDRQHHGHGEKRTDTDEQPREQLQLLRLREQLLMQRVQHIRIARSGCLE